MLFQLVSKTPHRTSWLRVLYTEAEADDLAKLREDIKAIGWNRPDGFREPSPCFYIDIPGIEGKHSETDINGPVGSALFGGWDDAERRKNLRVVKAFLKDRTPWKIEVRKLGIEHFL